MLRFSGEKLNLLSGMASAASVTSFSTALICRSKVEASVGAACEGCAWAAGAPVLLAPAFARAEAAKMSAADSNTTCVCFIRIALLDAKLCACDQTVCE